MDEGPKVKIKNIDFMGNKALSDGDLQGAMKQNKEQLVPVVHHRPRHLPGEPSSRRTPSEIVENYRERGLHLRAGRRARAEVPRRLEGRGHPLGRAAGSGHRGRALPDRQVHLRRQHGREEPTPCGRCSRSRKATGTARRRSARDSRRPRRSTGRSATTSSPVIRSRSRARMARRTATPAGKAAARGREARRQAGPRRPLRTRRSST